MMFQPGDSVGESNYHKFLGNKLCWDTIPPCISWTVRNGWCIVWLQAGAGNPGDDVVKSSHYLSRLCVTTGFDLGGSFGHATKLDTILGDPFGAINTMFYSLKRCQAFQTMNILPEADSSLCE
ncbi:hypothetical protein CDAR_405521 [Caerostris darwini]|uniref:Uncharacterized protein n=1 Tax=Caerostris darwini TaxID=1538125 RepID=A0AAV4WF02_9ARAC|nr:hypothetical protein CDAR_405521 [Caerostris darwini]